MKKVIVISLGGSLIIPHKVNLDFLNRFKEVILKNKNKYKFVIVCGGGLTARNYIDGLEEENFRDKEYYQCLLGVSVTRLNARFMTYFFGKDANTGIPHDMKDVKNLLSKNDIVFCGALRYAPKETSDSTASKLAHFFNSDFLNMTNVLGLYTKNPKEHKDAKFISEISYNKFLKMTKKIKYKPGQHFVLDQSAAKMIKKYKILTYIVGPDTENLDNFLNRRHFVGTIIS